MTRILIILLLHHTHGYDYLISLLDLTDVASKMPKCEKKTYSCTMTTQMTYYDKKTKTSKIEMYE